LNRIEYGGASARKYVIRQFHECDGEIRLPGGSSNPSGCVSNLEPAMKPAFAIVEGRAGVGL
jgi:hypothetical protein